jgi:hypothetical protein
MVYGQRDTNYTTGQIITLANKYQVDGILPAIVIDSDGIGGAVADNLIAWNKNLRVIQIHSNATSSKPDKFGNLRAEMWWMAGEKYSIGEVEDSYGGEFKDELDTELAIPTYYFRNGKIYVESKDDLKKTDRLGRSTDLADMRIYYLHALDQIETDEDMIKKKVISERRPISRTENPNSYMAV